VVARSSESPTLRQKPIFFHFILAKVLKMQDILDWLGQNPTVRVPLAVALIGITGAIVGGLFTVVIWPLVRTGLEHLAQKLKFSRSSRNFELRYLDSVIQEHRTLRNLPTTLVPVAESRAQELDKLYVSLAITENPQRTKEISLEEAVCNHQLLVILGDPGAGKTTMLQFLALTFARARREKPPKTRGKVDKERELAIFKDARRRVKDDFFCQNFPLPIFISMNRFTDVNSWPQTKTLTDALTDIWRANDTLRDFPKEFLDKKVNKGECIFLIDAFDELGTQDAREAMSQRIRTLAETARYGNRFIVTSRIVGYHNQLSDRGFHNFVIQPLSPELISELVKKWYISLNEPDLAAELLGTLKENPRIFELAVNPMLLSLIVLVQCVRRLIPDKRHVLYDECINILIERRYTSYLVRQKYDSVIPNDVAVRLLRQIALMMHESGLRRVSRGELEEIFIPRALKKMSTSRVATVSPRDILENIQQRSQIIDERGFDDKGQTVMAFSHLTFQEYLTSVALKEATSQKGEALISSELLRNYKMAPEWWQEVVLLYAAQLDDPQQESFLERLYPSRTQDRQEVDDD